MKFIYSDNIPKEVHFFTSGKRYEVIDSFNDYRKDGTYQVTVKGDDDKEYGPINIGKPCAYLNDGLWTVEFSDQVENSA